MSVKRLRITPIIRERTKTSLKDDAPKKPVLIKGLGNVDLVCGNCGHILVEGFIKGSIQNSVLGCPGCGAENYIA